MGKLVALIGWLGVAIGLLLVVGAFTEESGRGRILVLPAIGMALSGLVLVVQGQVLQAMVDVASHTGELVAYTRRIVMRDDGGIDPAGASNRRQEPTFAAGPELRDLAGAAVRSKSVADDMLKAGDETDENKGHGDAKQEEGTKDLADKETDREDHVEYKGRIIYRKEDLYHIKGFDQGYVSIDIAKIVIDRGDA